MVAKTSGVTVGRALPRTMPPIKTAVTIIAIAIMLGNRLISTKPMMIVTSKVNMFAIS